MAVSAGRHTVGVLSRDRPMDFFEHGHAEFAAEHGRKLCDFLV